MRAILAAIFMGFCVGRAYCLSYSTAEGQIARTMAFCIEQYHQKYGKLPTEWSELDEFMNRPMDEYFRYAPPSKRYAFVPSFPLLPPIEGEIVAVTRKPTYEVTLSSGLFGLQTDLKGPGRFVIFRNAKGQFPSRWVNEEYIVRSFAEAKQALPTPDNEPEPKPISNARKEIYIRRSVYAVVILVPIGGYYLIKRRRRKSTEQTRAANPRPCGTSGMSPADSASRAGDTPEASGDS